MKKYFLLTVMLALTTACSKEPSVQRTVESPQYGFTVFINGIAKFPYEAPKARQEKVQGGYAQIKLGMNKEDVKKLLGEPDAEFMTYRASKGKETLASSSWAYYLARREIKFANEKYDKIVFIHFDANEKLYWAVPSNVERLARIGEPPRD